MKLERITKDFIKASKRTEADLRKKIKGAKANASRQRRRAIDGIQIRVRAEFWEQVARDYARELRSLLKNREKLLQPAANYE